ncbi:hypothetical protein D3C87_1923150 [compost metagenome]
MIELSWCEADRSLTIGKRTGEYAGMQAVRQFAVELAGQAGSCIVTYEGEAVTVREEDLHC